MPSDALFARALEAPFARPWHRRRRWSEMALILVLAVGACSSGPSTNGARAMPEQERAELRTPGAPASLSDLRNLDQLAMLFDQHQDVPQLILMLSPT